MKFQSRSNKRWKFVKKEHTSWQSEWAWEREREAGAEEANIHRSRCLLCFSTSKASKRAQNSQYTKCTAHTILSRKLFFSCLVFASGSAVVVVRLMMIPHASQLPAFTITSVSSTMSSVKQQQSCRRNFKFSIFFLERIAIKIKPRERRWRRQ